MDYLINALITALKLIITFDYEVMNCTLVSLKVSSIAVFFSTIIGIPLGFLIALNQFTGKKTIITILNTLMALPTVVVGLLVFAFISRQGPLGVLGLLFTPAAMVVGQFILATPIITALSISAV
ncbi:MAG: ABC transporter permease, partial [Thermodesulfobacteriota bacterium]|nr:ABC transporter permease [Thermodesulfobacteriota bacterium]